MPEPVPYIITTTNRFDHAADVEHLLRGPRAVATLDNARERVPDLIDGLDTHTDRQSYRSEWTHVIDKARDLPESGGAFHLPDGSTITVKPTTWLQLSIEAGAEPYRLDEPPSDALADWLCAAWNQAHDHEEAKR